MLPIPSLTFDFMSEHITGDRFKTCCDVVVNDEATAFNYNGLKQARAIWCKTDYLDILFKSLHWRDAPVVLVTHNSDYPIDEKRFCNRPKCVSMWYAQNVDCAHPCLMPIPIGLENAITPTGYSGDASMVFCASMNGFRREILLYMNFNIATRPDERGRLWKMFSGKNWLIDWEYPIPFEKNLDLTSKAKFVLCPRGNGIDTHRMWESLYVGAIPVVKDCVHVREFAELPIVIVKSWEEVTEAFLKKKYDEMERREWNLNRLKLSWWKGRIRCP